MKPSHKTEGNSTLAQRKQLLLQQGEAYRSELAKACRQIAQGAHAGSSAKGVFGILLRMVSKSTSGNAADWISVAKLLLPLAAGGFSAILGKKIWRRAMRVGSLAGALALLFRFLKSRKKTHDS